MRRYMDLLVRYFVQYAKVRMGYRADFFISLFTTTLATGFGLATVFLVFRAAPPMRGWTYHEILFLFGYSLLPLSLFNVLSINLYYFPDNYLIQGKFDRVLLRPVSSLFQILFENFRLEAFGDTVLGVGVMVYAGWQIGMTWTPGMVVMTVVTALLGTALYVAVFLALTCVSFWVEDRAGILPPVYNMLMFGRYPLEIYGDIIKFILSWIVPFGFAVFYPTAWLLGHHHAIHQEQGAWMWAMFAVTAVFLTMAIWIWNRGVRNYGSTGS